MTTEAVDELELEEDLDAHERDLDGLAEAWVVWCRTHALYEPSSALGAALARRGALTRPMPSRIDSAISAASLAAFHIAFSMQPDAIDKQVFSLYYVERIKPIKTAAAALGIGKSQFYRVLQAFRSRVARAARVLEGQTAAGLSSPAAAYSLQVLSMHAQGGDVNDKSVSP